MGAVNRWRENPGNRRSFTWYKGWQSYIRCFTLCYRCVLPSCVAKIHNLVATNAQSSQFYAPSLDVVTPQEGIWHSLLSQPLGQLTLAQFTEIFSVIAFLYKISHSLLYVTTKIQSLKCFIMAIASLNTTTICLGCHKSYDIHKIWITSVVTVLLCMMHNRIMSTA